MMQDPEVESAPGPTREELLRIDQLVLVQVNAAQAVERLQSALDAARERLRRVSETDLPEAMDAAGLRRLTLSNGIVAEVKTSYHAKQLSSDDGLAYIVATGAGALIKHDLSMQFGRGQERLVARILKRVAAWKSASEFKLSQKSAVNAQTLGAWVRERVAAGDSLPFETLGVYVRRYAEVAAPVRLDNNE